MDFLETLISSLLAAWLAVFFHLRNHRSVHAWNEKFKVYSEVIEGLTKIISIHQSLADTAWGMFDPPSAEEVRMAVKVSDRLYEIRLMEGWILPAEVGTILSEGQSHPDLYENEDFFNRSEARHVINNDIAKERRSQLERIVVIARRDLGFDRVSWWRRCWKWAQENLSLAW